MNTLPFFNRFKPYYKTRSERQITLSLKRICETHFNLISKYNISLHEHTFNPDTNPLFFKPSSKEITFNYLDHDKFGKLFRNLSYNPTFNPHILMLYIMIGDTTRAPIIGNYELYSFKQLCHKINQYKRDGLTYVDIGHKSIGMGHVEVLRMDIENGGLFIQPDGGSSGYERSVYWNKYKVQKVSETEHISWEDFVKIAHKHDYEF